MDCAGLKNNSIKTLITDCRVHAIFFTAAFMEADKKLPQPSERVSLGSQGQRSQNAHLMVAGDLTGPYFPLALTFSSWLCNNSWFQHENG